ncbi:MAG: hypothetical protein ACO3JL_08600 [Myxococcota bacterium]
MGILSLFAVVIVIVAVVGSFRRQGQLLTPAVVDEPVEHPLPEELVGPMADLCHDVTARSLSIRAGWKAAQARLSGRDGLAGVEAAQHFSETDALREMLAEVVTEAVEVHQPLPEEADWWLTFVLEKLEALAAVDDGERVSGGNGGQVAQGALVRALEETDALLFACHEFADRMLEEDLAAWVRREVGRDEGRAMSLIVAEQQRLQG